MQNCQVELDPRGYPRHRAGANAHVYKLISCTGMQHALRVFLHKSDNREQRYRAIHNHLQQIRSQAPSLIGFEYYPKGILIERSLFPAMLMDWVDGTRLDLRVKELFDGGDLTPLLALADKWVVLLRNLRAAQVAHGSLHHADIMVKNGELLLVDYDTMCVPSLVGHRSPGSGLPAYQHPRRSEQPLSLELDHFSAWIIWLSLRAIAAQPQLYQDHVLDSNNDNLLFRSKDIFDPNNSVLWPKLLASPDEEVRHWAGKIRESLDRPFDDIPLFMLAAEKNTPAEMRSLPASRSSFVQAHLASFSLCHVDSPALAADGVVRWLRSGEAVGRSLPLALARDLGALLTRPRSERTLARPAHLPFELNTSAYLAFLERFAAHPLVCELPRLRPPLTDAVVGVLLARLLEGVRVPDCYRLGPGPPDAAVLEELSQLVKRANPATIWRETPLAERPDWNVLLPPAVLGRIEANLHILDREEVRFLARYGPALPGTPDPRDLLELLSLTGLPADVRLAMTQSLRLLPRLLGPRSAGGIQTYPEGGYEGLARKGSLDSLLPTEFAFPRAMMLHRVHNHEALYYGRERPRERRRELAYLVVQFGLGLGEDGQLLARALLLALSQAMSQRGYEVQYSFAGSTLSEPRSLDRPGEINRVLYHQETEAANPAAVLRDALRHLRGWRDAYRARQVLWVVSELFDADDFDEHEELYRELRHEGEQQAWFIRVGASQPAKESPPPLAARCFPNGQVVATDILWQHRDPPPRQMCLRQPQKKERAVERRRLLPAPRTMTIYADLASQYAQRNDPGMREVFLVLAADAALRKGDVTQAEEFRRVMLSECPDHLLKPWRNFAEAAQTPDVEQYLAELRERYPPEVAEEMIEALLPGVCIRPRESPGIPL